jgi:hypothetical protein
MRFSLLLPLAAVMAVLALAPAASARLISPDPTPAPATQNLQSPDAQDANAAQHAQSLQDLARLHAINGGTSLEPKPYTSSVHTRQVATDDGTPWDAIAAGIALIAVVAAAVGIAVRSRRRVSIAA